MSGRGCVTDLELRAFLLGDLPEPVSDDVSSHLETCSDCEAAARRLDGLSDRMIRSLQRVLGEEAGDPRPHVTLVPTPRAAGEPLAPDGPTRVAAADRLPHVKGYELLEELGRGGMGVVFRARHVRLNRVVALKVILSGAFASPAELRRFRTEAEAAAQLDHPHIVPLYEAGEQEGLPYFSMKLIEGTRLSAHVRRLSQEPRAAVPLLVSVARAVHHAHQRGVIHRDLKPANILIDADGGPHVTDFGLSGRVGGDAGVTQSGAVVGTPSYMAPEQAACKKGLTTAVDVYALGAILYELLTGRAPFHGATPAETVRHVLEREPPSPRAVNPRADRDLELICLKCMEKEPQRRYGSAEAMAADLDHWLAGEPLSVRPPSFSYQARKFAGRHKWTLAAAAAVAATLLLAVGSVGWVVRDRAARRAALEHDVARALDEAEAEYLRDAPTEADAAVRQAEGLLASGAGTGEPLVQRVRRWRTDLTMVARLEEIRLNREGFSDSVKVKGNAELDYQEAFRRYGLDVQVLDPAVAAGRVRASRVRARLLAALDDWALSKWVDLKSSGERLLAILLEADPDPWRDRLRHAIARKDAAALAELARDKQATSQALTTVLLLGQALEGSGQSILAVEVLRQAHLRHPDDFWLNYNLGCSEHLYSTSTDETVGFLRVAVALRPGSPNPWLDLALALERHGNSIAAEAELRELVRVLPDFAVAHYYLGVMLQTNGSVDEAVAEHRKAIRLAPGNPAANSALGNALGEKGLLDDSVAAYEVAVRLAKDPVHRARVHEDLGGMYARNGGLAEAAAAFHRSLVCDPTNHQAWCMAAMMDIASGDAKAYHRTCGQMLVRFGSTGDPQVAERTATTCSLAPDAADDFAVVEGLAERAVRGNEKHRYFRYFAYCKGITEYRSGNDAEAVKWLRRFSPRAGGDGLDASVFSVLAMANHRMGKTQDANAALHEATAIVSAKMPDGSKDRPFVGTNYREWLPCRLLVREAETLLN